MLPMQVFKSENKIKMTSFVIKNENRKIFYQTKATPFLHFFTQKTRACHGSQSHYSRREQHGKQVRDNFW